MKPIKNIQLLGLPLQAYIIPPHQRRYQNLQFYNRNMPSNARAPPGTKGDIVRPEIRAPPLDDDSHRRAGRRKYP